MNAKKLLVAALSASMILGAAPVFAEENKTETKVETKEVNYKEAYFAGVVAQKEAAVKNLEEEIKKAEDSAKDDALVKASAAQLEVAKKTLKESEEALAEYEKKNINKKIKELLDKFNGTNGDPIALAQAKLNVRAAELALEAGQKAYEAMTKSYFDGTTEVSSKLKADGTIEEVKPAAVVDKATYDAASDGLKKLNGDLTTKKGALKTLQPAVEKPMDEYDTALLADWKAAHELAYFEAIKAVDDAKMAVTKAEEKLASAKENSAAGKKVVELKAALETAKAELEAAKAELNAAKAGIEEKKPEVVVDNDGKKVVPNTADC